MILYLSCLIRTVIALYDLINNKIRYNEAKNTKYIFTKEGSNKQCKQVTKITELK